MRSSIVWIWHQWSYQNIFVSGHQANINHLNEQWSCTSNLRITMICIQSNNDSKRRVFYTVFLCWKKACIKRVSWPSCEPQYVMVLESSPASLTYWFYRRRIKRMCHQSPCFKSNCLNIFSLLCLLDPTDLVASSVQLVTWQQVTVPGFKNV